MGRVQGGLPFLVGLLLAWPGTAAQSSSFQDLFARYRGSDADGAVREFATWPESRVASEARLSPEQLSEPWTAAALALFHFESGLEYLGLRRGLTERDSSGPPDPDHIAHHFRRSEALVDDVLLPAAKRTADPDLLAFCRNWYIVFDTLDAGPTWGQRLGPIQSVHRNLKEDPDIQLLYGIYVAKGAGPFAIGDSPYAIGGPDSEAAKRGLVSVGGDTFYAGGLRDAELAFRRALELAPSLVEARVRLGRLYQAWGRKREAEVELGRARSEAAAKPDRITAYLASLFLGQLFEDTGRTSEAEDAYRTAIGTYPAGTAARLALGSLLFANGRIDDAATATRSALIWLSSVNWTDQSVSRFRSFSARSFRARNLQVRLVGDTAF